MGLILDSGRFPGGGNGNPLQYSSLGNPMDRGAWWAIVYGMAKNKREMNVFQSPSCIFLALIGGGLFFHFFSV